MENASPSAPRRSRSGRRFSMAAVAMATAVILSACLTPQQDSVLAELNHDRWVYGLPVLNIHGDAQNKAQAWAEKIARDGKLSHSNLSSGIGVRWCSLGENVGYGAGPSSIQKAYMQSSGHRANILDRKWNGVGVGYAKGRVNGVEVVFTVQVFIQTC